MQKTDEIGKKYSMLTIVKETGRNKKGGVEYLCLCDCGNTKIMSIHHIRRGDTKSCGCRRVFLTQNRRGNIPVFINGKINYINPSQYDKKIHIKTDIYNTVLEESNRKENWMGCGEIPKRFWNEILYSSKNRKKKNDMKFEITIEYIWELFLKQNRKCALTGLNLIMPYYDSCKQIRVGTASLDRIDSSKGYVEGNVQWVHKDINIMKNIYTENYFIDMCKHVAKNCEIVRI